jgi:hypothetical protein
VLNHVQGETVHRPRVQRRQHGNQQSRHPAGERDALAQWMNGSAFVQPL